MRYSLFYGTLRAKPEPQFNFNRCGLQTYIRTLRLKGYDLYDCGLPIVAAGKGTITVELHAIDEQTDARIRGMELGAGYKEVIIAVGEDNASLYVYPPSQIALYPSKFCQLVESGDWVEHLKGKK